MRTPFHPAWLLLPACLFAPPLLSRGAAQGPTSKSSSTREVPPLPDLSGLAWIEGDRFLAVHDAKRPGQPRASVVQIPTAPGAPLGHPLAVTGPATPPADLESAARIPPLPGAAAGPPAFFLVESGSGGEGFRRVFRTEYRSGDTLKLSHVADLPKSVANIEGSAAYRIGDRLLLLFVERGEREVETRLSWAEVPSRGGPTELKLSSGAGQPFRIPGVGGPTARQVSDLALDSRGWIYVASTLDPGDAGPFRSQIWRIGWLNPLRSGQLDLVLSPDPQQVAQIDGFKVEALTTRELPDGRRQLFIGTDDELYGGALRLLGALPED
jgi:hypothetical protein